MFFKACLFSTLLLLLQAPAAFLQAPAAFAETTGKGAQPIVGGMQATAGSWRDAGALLLDGDATCTVVLVAPDVALTAAHCLWDTEYSEIAVVVGSQVYSEGERIPVLAATLHPDYAETDRAIYKTADLAVLQLEREADVEPRKVATPCMVDNWLFEGSPVTAVGFGAHDVAAQEYDAILRQATLTVLNPDCRDAADDCLPGRGFIATHSTGNTCNGDSGGPVYLPTPRGAVLLGLTQGWLEADENAVAEDEEVTCDLPGVYVRTDARIDWIERVTNRKLDVVDCNRGAGCAASGQDVAGIGGALLLLLCAGLVTTRRRRQ